MNLQKLLLGLSIFSSLVLPFNLVKAAPVYAASTQIIQIEAKPVDKRAQILKDYLAKHNSPLENSAQDIASHRPVIVAQQRQRQVARMPSRDE